MKACLVQDVNPNSAAAEKGFAVGDTILEVNNRAVGLGRRLRKAIQGVKDAGRGTALVKAQRDGDTRFIGLPIDKANVATAAGLPGRSAGALQRILLAQPGLTTELVAATAGTAVGRALPAFAGAPPVSRGRHPQPRIVG